MAQWLIMLRKELKIIFGRFSKLYEQIKNDKINKDFLDDIYKKDKIFPDINYMIYS